MKSLTFLLTIVLSGFSVSLSAQQSQSALPEEKAATSTASSDTPPSAQPPLPKFSEPKPSAPETKSEPRPLAPKSKSESKPPSPKPKPKPRKYVIQSGDNPWTIAKDHGVDHAELLRINKIKDPKNIKIGDVLILPEGVVSKNAPKKNEAKPTAPPASESQPGDGNNGWEMYTIQKGDNPWSIAKKLNLDHQKILSLNEGLDFRDLKVGQQIKIPKKS